MRSRAPRIAAVRELRARVGPIQRDGNPEGELSGEILVFTGALKIPRRDAATMAAEIGRTVGSSVTKKTTLLVVGDQDVEKTSWPR